MELIYFPGRILFYIFDMINYFIYIFYRPYFIADISDSIDILDIEWTW